MSRATIKERMSAYLKLHPESMKCTNNEIVSLYTDFFHPDVQTKDDLLEKVQVETITRVFRSVKEEQFYKGA
jgi:hypothetical protein